ncbi:EF1G-domain-containing protein [Violaceomyces palustris]|uniref:EF1G-domain-containing protein n=1 Tax=Violaceomyces palustris TaxID=1673888 RepID=A0ACD0NZC5_9BASI|nr:EF1G-domain-containing protein [Violaceomyces palustris]
MAPIGKIYGYVGHAKVNRTLAAAKYNGLEIEVVETQALKGDTRKPEYLAEFPLGKIPAFVGSDGFKLVEGRAIARYVAGLSDNAKLLGADAQSAALVEQWIDFADEEIFNNAVQILFLINGIVPYNKAAETKAWDNIDRALTYLENYLKSKTFLVGHRITLADLTLAANIRMLYTRFAGASVQNKFPNTLRYFHTVANQPTIVDIYGGYELLAENAKFVPPKKEEKPKAAAAAAAPAKKQEKPAKAAEEDDDEPKPEPKVKNPLDDLPKSSFILDEWKRTYSNEETPKALSWFHEHFDREGYSAWQIDFKYNDELTQVFMSANQIGGFFSRLEASRKYVFGTMGVFGEANDSAISGVMIVRGQDAETVLGVAPDLESYSLKKLDLTNAEDKKSFDDYCLWEKVLADGKKWADGKIMK